MITDHRSIEPAQTAVARELDARVIVDEKIRTPVGEFIPGCSALQIHVNPALS